MSQQDRINRWKMDTSVGEVCVYANLGIASIHWGSSWVQWRKDTVRNCYVRTVMNSSTGEVLEMQTFPPKQG